MLFVSVLFAFALVAVGERGRPVLVLIESASQVFFRMVGLVMWAAPIGAFGAIAFVVGKFGWGSLVQLGSLIAEFYVVCAVFTALVFGLIARAVGVNLWRLMVHIREELLVTAATTSSEDGAAGPDGQDARLGLRGIGGRAGGADRLQLSTWTAPACTWPARRSSWPRLPTRL